MSATRRLVQVVCCLSVCQVAGRMLGADVHDISWSGKGVVTGYWCVSVCPSVRPSVHLSVCLSVSGNVVVGYWCVPLPPLVETGCNSVI
jgi:hypothetical protein